MRTLGISSSPSLRHLYLPNPSISSSPSLRLCPHCSASGLPAGTAASTHNFPQVSTGKFTYAPTIFFSLAGNPSPQLAHTLAPRARLFNFSQAPTLAAFPVKPRSRALETVHFPGAALAACRHWVYFSSIWIGWLRSSAIASSVMLLCSCVLWRFSFSR